MTFTYSSTASGTAVTALHKTRLEIGDTDSTASLYADEEINVYLGTRGSTDAGVLLASADLLEAAANKYARAYDFETDGQRFQRSQMCSSFRAQAKALRERAHGVSTVELTRIDGYSDDIGNQDVGETAENKRLLYRRSRSPDKLP